MAGLYKKYEKDGFHIIGLESQGSSAAAIDAYAKAAGITFQLAIHGGIKGANVTGIPHGFLFGADGKLAANDPEGAELEKKIKELLKDPAVVKANAEKAKPAAPDHSVTYVLKDGTRIKAVQTVDSGDELSLKDDTGKFITIKKADIAEKIGPAAAGK